MLLLQTNDVQAMLLQSEKVLEMHFPGNWRPKFRDIELSNSKETESLGKIGCRQKL